MKELAQCLWAFTGTYALGILFNIRGKNSFYAAFGGMFGWAVYLFSGHFVSSSLVQFFTASIAISIYAECMAIWRKTPVTVFIISGMIPLVPGGTIFYTMQELIMGNTAGFFKLGIYTIAIAGSIAMGILSASFVVKTLRYGINCFLNRKKSLS